MFRKLVAAVCAIAFLSGCADLPFSSYDAVKIERYGPDGALLAVKNVQRQDAEPLVSALSEFYGLAEAYTIKPGSCAQSALVYSPYKISVTQNNIPLSSYELELICGQAALRDPETGALLENGGRSISAREIEDMLSLLTAPAEAKKE